MEHVPHLFLLGAHIFFVGGAATHLNGLTADDFDPVAFQTDDLARVVGHDAELADAQIKEYLRADAVIAEVRLEAELFVGFNGVVALILKGIGLQLVGEANAPGERRAQDRATGSVAALDMVPTAVRYAGR